MDGNKPGIVWKVPPTFTKKYSIKHFVNLDSIWIAEIIGGIIKN
jgi:hypothetical protein